MSSETTEHTTPPKPIASDEIDLIEVLKKIWTGRKTIYISVVISFAIGIIIILGTPKEYKSEITLLSETSTKSAGGLGQLAGLAGMAGINIGNGTTSNALTIDLYPDIVNSTPFLLEIMNQKVTESKTNKTISVAEYFDNYTKPSIGKIIIGYTIGLPSKLKELFKKKEIEKALIQPHGQSGLINLTPRQSNIIKAIKNCINLELEKRSGIFTNKISLYIETQDPNISAQLADSVVTCLRRYITNYYTGKSKKDLEFVTARYNEIRDKFYSIQQTLASHKDQNMNVIMATSNISTERLQIEYTLTSNIYNTLAQQLEQAKLKVQEQTPVFTVIEPAEVSSQKSKPNTIFILITSLFAGVFIGTMIIIVNQLKYRLLKLNLPNKQQ